MIVRLSMHVKNENMFFKRTRNIAIRFLLLPLPSQASPVSDHSPLLCCKVGQRNCLKSSAPGSSIFDSGLPFNPPSTPSPCLLPLGQA